MVGKRELKSELVNCAMMAHMLPRKWARRVSAGIEGSSVGSETERTSGYG